VTFLLHPPFQQSAASCSLGLQSGQGKNEHIFSPTHLPRSSLSSTPTNCHLYWEICLVCRLSLFLHDLRLLLVLKEGRCTMWVGWRSRLQIWTPTTHVHYFPDPSIVLIFCCNVTIKTTVHASLTSRRRKCIFRPSFGEASCELNSGHLVSQLIVRHVSWRRHVTSCMCFCWEHGHGYVATGITAQTDGYFQMWYNRLTNFVCRDISRCCRDSWVSSCVVRKSGDHLSVLWHNKASRSLCRGSIRRRPPLSVAKSGDDLRVLWLNQVTASACCGTIRRAHPLSWLNQVTTSACPGTIRWRPPRVVAQSGDRLSVLWHNKVSRFPVVAQSGDNLRVSWPNQVIISACRGTISWLTTRYFALWIQNQHRENHVSNFTCHITVI
jgi:hypothetical protein